MVRARIFAKPFANYHYDIRKMPSFYLAKSIDWTRLEYEKQVFRDEILRDVQKGRGLGRFWQTKIYDTHQITGPSIPFKFFSRYVYRSGDFWTLALHDRPEERWKVAVWEKSPNKYQFGTGWNQFMEDNDIKTGEMVGFSASENINALFVVRGTEAIENYVCREYPKPYIRYWEYLGIPEKTFLSFHDFKYFGSAELPKEAQSRFMAPQNIFPLQNLYGQRQTELRNGVYAGHRHEVPWVGDGKKRAPPKLVKSTAPSTKTKGGQRQIGR